MLRNCQKLRLTFPISITAVTAYIVTKCNTPVWLHTKRELRNDSANFLAE